MGLLKSLPIGPVTISRRIMFLKTHGNISVKLGLFDQSGLRPNPHPPPKKKRKRKVFLAPHTTVTFSWTAKVSVLLFMDSKGYSVIVPGQQKLLCYCSHGQQKAPKKKERLPFVKQNL
jgi:hypothetical protein